MGPRLAGGAGATYYCSSRVLDNVMLPVRCFGPLSIVLLAGSAAAQSGSTQKTLDASDLASWRSIRAATISADGKWFAYQLVPNEGDGELAVRPTAAGATERRFGIGQPATPRFDFTAPSFAPPAAGVLFSGDGRWLAYSIFPTAVETKRLAKEKKPAQQRLGLVDLASGQQREFEKISRFAFAGERPNWLVAQRYPAEGATGSDLLLVDLRTGTVGTVGSVAEFALDETGGWLAWTTDAKDMVGNGLQVRNLGSDQVRTLESEPSTYRRLAWADSGFALTVLRGKPDSARGDTVFAVVGFAGIGTAAQSRVVFDPSADASFPAGMRISPDRAPKWTTGFGAIAFGLTSRRSAPEGKTGRPDVKPVAGTPGIMQTPAGVGGSEDDLPSLVIWHGREARLQSMQQVEERRDKAYSYLALYRVADRRFLRLATDDLREVQLTPRERFAWGADRRGYERRDNIDGGQRRDYYAIDLATGERTQFLTAGRYPILGSPDGTKALYYHDGEYHVYDFVAKQSRVISQGAPTTFVDTEDDHNVDRPPVFPLGWAADSRSVLLFDNWDVWRVGTGGGDFSNLTGNGRRDRIRYTRRVVIDPKERGIDLTKPIYLQVYGERTKQEGLARIAPGRPGAERLFFDDAKYLVARAKNADTWIYSRQTFTAYPDYWTSDGRFGSPTRLTDGAPQQREYAWSAGARLIDYVSEKGDSLQGALYLPANYEPGRKYPTVVYIYEKLSQGLHSYAVPNETRAFNPSVYTSRGYAVLQPDIVYRVNDPGMSALWCVVPAVKAAIASGIVDPAKVGLHGHSWGGYQSAFLATQTGKLFSGIVSGAPLTDMISMYASVYWNTGTADMAIFESSQGRFLGSYLDHSEAYVRNSPNRFVKQVETPIMILHNEKDGAVDFNQGITFFNSLREQDKDVIMLQYVGENHGLQAPQNQKDYTIRMQEYFDHYVRGLPAPEWIKEGVPRLEMDEHLKSRQKKPKTVSMIGTGAETGLANRKTLAAR